MSTRITVDLLAAALPGAKRAHLEKYAPYIDGVAERFAIDTELRLAHFLGQVAHECGSFSLSVENLNYSAEALKRVFGKYFPGLPGTANAEAYARQPEKIANLVYANRMGNGSQATGDGWKYRGRGCIQLTGRDNYLRCGAALNLPLAEQPDLLLEPGTALAAAGWFWSTKGINRLADRDDIVAVTERINGGQNGLDDRTVKTTAFKRVLGIA